MSKVVSRLPSAAENLGLIGLPAPIKSLAAQQWDAIIVPSVPDEAPEGLDSTGSAVFNSMWTVRCSHFQDQY